MRRGGMRLGPRDAPGGLRVWLVPVAALVLMAVAAAGACQRGTPPGGPPTSAVTSTSASPSPSPPPADPLVTLEVCGLALAATDTTITLFLEQKAALEQAGSRNDGAAMLEASQAIDEQFVSLADTFTDLAERPIDPALRAELTFTAQTLEVMSSREYLGGILDIHVKLLEFQSALEGLCSAARPPAG